MPAPDAVLKLCETFAEHRAHFHQTGIGRLTTRCRELAENSSLSGLTRSAESG